MNVSVSTFAPIAAIMLTLPNDSWSDATLVGLDLPGRPPGSFLVTFKIGAELTAVPRKGPGAPKLLPKIFPTSAKDTQRLAEALCARIRAKLEGAFYWTGTAAFLVHDASDDAIRNVLAMDPRVAQIGANFTLAPRK